MWVPHPGRPAPGSERDLDSGGQNPVGLLEARRRQVVEPDRVRRLERDLPGDRRHQRRLGIDPEVVAVFQTGKELCQLLEVRRGGEPVPERRGAPRRDEVVAQVERAALLIEGGAPFEQDRKSTRLNSSHSQISYAVFCLKKK